ncbi:MAG: hypothetical protein V7703_21220 [Hyphomicrobiales bacterium]
MSNTQFNIGVLDSGQIAQDLRRFAARKISTTVALMACYCDSTHRYHTPHPVQLPIVSSNGARISNKKTIYGCFIDVENADGVLGDCDLTMAMWKALPAHFCTVHR